MVLEWNLYSILNISLKIICICVAGLIEVVYLRKFIQKRTRPRFFILIVITGLLLFPLCWLIDDLFYDTLFSETRIGFATSMVLVEVLFIALFFFAYEIYFTRQNQTSKAWILFCYVYSIVDFIVAIIISQRFLHPNEVPDAFGFFLFFVFSVMLGLVIILLGFRSFQLARKVTDERFRVALMAMGSFVLCMILVFVFEIMDWVMFEFRDYSILNSLAFGSLLILYYFIYKGFIKPAD